MVTPELLDFVRVQYVAGATKEAIEQMLMSEGGWTKDDVHEAFFEIFKDVPAASPPAPPPPPAQPSVSPAPIVFSVPPIEVIPEKTAEPAPPEAVTIPEDSPRVVPIVRTSPAVETPQMPATPPVSSPAPEPSPVVPSVPPPVESVVAGLIVPTDVPPPVVVTQDALEESPEEPLAPVSEITPPEGIEEVVKEHVTVHLQPGEDFLGIFSFANSPEVKVIVAPEAAPAAKSTSHAEDADAAIREPSHLTDRAAILRALPPVVPTEPASVFKFDFSKIRNVTPPEKAPTTAELAERLEAEGLSADLHGPVKSDTGVIHHLSHEEEEVLHEKMAHIGRRTMAGDLLLRGLAPVAPSPASTPTVPPPPHVAAPPPSVAPSAPRFAVDPPIQTRSSSAPRPSVPAPAFRAPLADDIKKKNQVRRLLGIAIGVTLLVAVVGGVAFAVMKMGGSNIGDMIASAFNQFFKTTSFSYKGTGNMNLMLSTTVDAVERTSTIKFDFGYNGSLKNGALGFGDGMHNFKATGGLGAGVATPQPMDFTSDVRLVGSSLYFHISQLPPSSNLDPEIAKTYWIKLDLSEFAKQLSLSGSVANPETYGNFGGQNPDSSLGALIKKFPPFTASEQLPDEVAAGVNSTHISMKANADTILPFVSEVYRKFLGKDLVLTDDKRVRLNDALRKMVAEVWINKETGALTQVSVSGDFDDDMFDVHVKGKMKFLFTFSELGRDVVVETPAPVLTLEELKVQMEQFMNSKAARVRDGEKVSRLQGILRSLASYKEAKGRYPYALTELYGAGIVATSTIPESLLEQYAYASYVSRAPLSKANRCTPSGKACDFYHIGVNLEDKNGPLMFQDVDMTSDVLGSDTAGCGGERGVACYDMISPPSNPAADPQPAAVVAPKAEATAMKPAQPFSFALKIIGGGGTIKTNDQPNSCENSCSGVIPVGSTIKFTVSPLKGYKFDSWGGDCSGTNPVCNHLTNGNLSVTAKFSAIGDVATLQSKLKIVDFSITKTFSNTNFRVQYEGTPKDFDIYLDTDNNTTTGKPDGAIGADYVIAITDTGTPHVTHWVSQTTGEQSSPQINIARASNTMTATVQNTDIGSPITATAFVRITEAGGGYTPTSKATKY